MLSTLAILDRSRVLRFCFRRGLGLSFTGGEHERESTWINGNITEGERVRERAHGLMETLQRGERESERERAHGLMETLQS